MATLLFTPSTTIDANIFQFRLDKSPFNAEWNIATGAYEFQEDEETIYELEESITQELAYDINGSFKLKNLKKMKKFEIVYVPNEMFTKTTTTVSASNIEEVNSKFSLGMIITINEKKNLINKTVKIENFLTFDPINKQGQQGKVISVNEIDEENADVTILFEDGSRGVYQLGTFEIL
jgi:hypothetical protein